MDCPSAGQRADADLELHDPGVVEAADGAAGAAEEFGGPAAQFGFWGVQVHGGGGVLGLQVQQAAGMRAQGEVGGVHQPDRARRGDRADADHEAGRGRALGLPGDERHRGEGGRPAAGAAHHLVRLQHGAGRRCGPAAERPAGVHAGDAAGLAGEDVRRRGFPRARPGGRSAVRSGGSPHQGRTRRAVPAAAGPVRARMLRPGR